VNTAKGDGVHLCSKLLPWGSGWGDAVSG
jgi:hypothetical protein